MYGWICIIAFLIALASSSVNRYGISSILRFRKVYCALAVIRKGFLFAIVNRSRRFFCCKNVGLV